jgi:hypothetical protein
MHLCWSILLDAFDCIINHMKILKATQFNFWGLQEKDIFKAFWFFFAFTKHETCNPKCRSHVHEIIMPRMCQSVCKRLFKNILQFRI